MEPGIRVTVIFPSDLYEWLDKVSRNEDRPIANMIRFIVRRYLETHHHNAGRNDFETPTVRTPGEPIYTETMRTPRFQTRRAPVEQGEVTTTRDGRFVGRKIGRGLWESFFREALPESWQTERSKRGAYSAHEKMCSGKIPYILSHTGYCPYKSQSHP